MIKIGLTGSIGSGKSTVSSYLIAKGFALVDADALVKEIYLDNAFIQQMRSAFGDVMSEDDPQQLDKKRIFDLVFSNKERLERLNQLIHPFIRNKILEKEQEFEKERVIFFDIPLLFERGYDKMMDRVVMVYCEDSLRWERASRRSNKTVEAIRSVDKMQMPQDEKKARADDVLDNSSTIESLYQQIEKLLKELGLEYER